jgi:hypothetical protein
MKNIARRHPKTICILAAAASSALAIPASALVINATYLSSVTSLSYASQIEAATNYVISEYESLYSNNITLNIDVNAGTTGLGGSSTNLQFSSYSAIRGKLAGLNSSSDQTTAAGYVPGSDPTGSSQWLVPNAEDKALGLGSPGGIDGTFTFNENQNYTFDPFNRGVGGDYDFIGVEEHEFSEIMGRISGLGGTFGTGKASYLPFDLYRFTSPGVRNLTNGNNIYFSYNGGNTNLKYYNYPNGNGSDPQDWLTTVPDSYNAFGGTGAQEALSDVDLNVMHVLGYNSQGGTTLTWDGASLGGIYFGNNWLSPISNHVNPCHGAFLYMNSASTDALQILSDNENLQLSNTSDMGQYLQVNNGNFIMGAGGSGAGYAMLINENGGLYTTGSGLFSVAGSLNVGNDSGVDDAFAEFYGSSTVQIGTVAVQTRALDVGVSGTGTVYQFDSATVSTPSLVVGDNYYGVGVYNMEAGGLTVSGDETIGNGGTGSFYQSGGATTVTGNLYIGNQYGSSGYVDATGGTTAINGNAYVSGNASSGGGTGVLTVAGGAVTVGGTLKIWNVSGASVNLSSGSLTVANLDDGGVSSLLNWTGGTLDITTDLDLLSVSDPYGHPNPFGSSLTLGSGQSLVVGDWEWIADLGGNVTQNTGSTNTNTYLYLGSSGATPATYTLNGGTYTTTGQDFIGYENFGLGIGGTGNFIQNGGTHTVGTMSVGYNQPGTYTQNGGTLNTTVIDVGSQGTFTQVSGAWSFASQFNQSGGVVNLDQGVNLYTASYNMSGGTLTTLNIYDYGNPSLFNWTGGTVTLTGQPVDISDGTDPDYNGIIFGNSLTLNSGMTLNADYDWEYLYGDNSSITQNAGSANNTPYLYVGNTSSGGGPAASVTLNGGTLSVANVEYIGYSGTYPGSGAGAIYQSGGTNSAGSLYLGYNGSGAYYLGGGSFQATYGTNIGYAAQGVFNQTGGSSSLGALTISSTGYIVMTGGTLGANSTANNGTISQTGGSSNMGDVTGTGNITVGSTSGGTAASMIVGALQQNSLMINATGFVQIDGGSSNTLNSLIINTGGILDMTNHHLFIDYGGGPDPIASIHAWLASGYNGGHWNGTGIDSSVAMVNPHYGLGFADGADLVAVGVGAQQIEIKYTLYGDINLDGQVSGSDFGILAAHFGHYVTGGWDEGDLNYDGYVNATDFGLLAGNFGKTDPGGAITLPASDWAALYAFAGANGLMADVPEPSSIGVAVAVGVASLAKRRRKVTGS